MSKFKKIISVLLVLSVLCVAVLLTACDSKTTTVGVRDASFGKQVTDLDGAEVYHYTYEKHDKAIIYVTALFTGGLYDYEEEKVYWEPFDNEYDMISWFNDEGKLELTRPINDGFLKGNTISTVLSAINYEPGTLLYELTVDEEGDPYNSNIRTIDTYPTYSTGNNKGEVIDSTYGVFGIYRPYVDGIAEVYGNDYSVEVFNQDWRITPAVSAEKLYNYIKAQGYEEVILMSHSMGGPVCNAYFSYCDRHDYDNKCSLYMAYAPATLGSYDALSALECLDKYLDVFLGGWVEGDVDELLGSLGGVIDLEEILGQFLGGTPMGDFISNCQGLITLVPSYQLLASEQYDNGKGGLGVIKEGESKVTWFNADTKTELYNFYKTRSWAYYYEKEVWNIETGELEYKKDADGNRIKIKIAGEEGYTAVSGKTDVYQDAEGTLYYTDPEGYWIKESVATLEELYDSMFIDGKLAQEQAENSYYFIGTEIETALTGMVYDENTKSWKLYTGETDSWGTYYRVSDGMVPTFSSMGGNSVTQDDIDDMVESGKCIEYTNKNHMQAGGDYEMMKDDIFKLLKEVIGY